MSLAKADVPLKPVLGPFNWNGPEMAQRTDWIRPLTSEEIAELETAVLRLDATGIDIADIGPNDLQVPGLQPLVEEMKRYTLREIGFILVRGVPVERWTTRQCAIAFFGLGAKIGEPVSQNAKGHILGHVKDIGRDYAKATSRGYQTSARLGYHSDASDIVALLCLKRSKSGGLSTIVSSPAIYNEMLKQQPDLAAALAGPIYRDRRGEVPEGGGEWCVVPVFNPMPDGGLVTNYARLTVEKAQRFPEVPRLTPEIVAAFDLLDSLAASPEFYLDMEFLPGDMQFLNNHWTLHSRTAYEDFPEPENRRHLFRLWLACDDGPAVPDAYTKVWQGATSKGRPAGIRVPGVKLNAPLEAE
jgi:hypothetical protein